jgi:hypothetical protein
MGDKRPLQLPDITGLQLIHATEENHHKIAKNLDSVFEMIVGQSVPLKGQFLLASKPLVSFKHPNTGMAFISHVFNIRKE